MPCFVMPKNVAVSILNSRCHVLLFRRCYMPKISLRFVLRMSLAITLALCLMYGATVQAQSPPASQEEATRQLLERVRELEAKVKQLEEKEAAAPAVPAAVP